jgi:tellurite resistance protein TehA-like permease
MVDMGDGLTAFIFGVGSGTWAYSKLMKSTNSPQNSIIGGAVTGIIGFFVIYTFLKYVLHY